MNYTNYFASNTETFEHEGKEFDVDYSVNGTLYCRDATRMDPPEQWWENVSIHIESVIEWNGDEEIEREDLKKIAETWICGESELDEGGQEC